MNCWRGVGGEECGEGRGLRVAALCASVAGSGRMDDPVDGASGASAKLTTSGPARLLSFPWL